MPCPLLSFHLTTQSPPFISHSSLFVIRRKKTKRMMEWKLTSRAITPAKENVTYTISYNPKTAHIRIFIDETMVREVHGFPTPSSSSSSSAASEQNDDEHKGKVFIGIMGCSPLGKGTDATFQTLEMREGVRDLV
jgi:hypothetical protein